MQDALGCSVKTSNQHLFRVSRGQIVSDSHSGKPLGNTIERKIMFGSC